MKRTILMIAGALVIMAASAPAEVVEVNGIFISSADAQRLGIAIPTPTPKPIPTPAPVTAPIPAPGYSQLTSTEIKRLLAQNVADHGQTQQNTLEMASLGKRINALSNEGEEAAHTANFERCAEIVSEMRPLVDRFNVLAAEVGVSAWIADGNRMLDGWKQTVRALARCHVSELGQ